MSKYLRLRYSPLFCVFCTSPHNSCYPLSTHRREARLVGFANSSICIIYENIRVPQLITTMENLLNTEHRKWIKHFLDIIKQNDILCKPTYHAYYARERNVWTDTTWLISMRVHANSCLFNQTKVNAPDCDPVSVCGHFSYFHSPCDNHYKHYPEWIGIWIDMNWRCEFWIFFKWIVVFDMSVTVKAVVAMKSPPSN